MNKVIIAFGILGLFNVAPSIAQVNTNQVSTPATMMTDDANPLKGILTSPVTPPKAIALILQGSGNVGADGDVSGGFMGTGYEGQPAKLSEELAQTLARSGFASFRYNKRGFDDSKLLGQQCFPYLQTDAKTAAAFLQAQYPGLPLYLVGFSEGAVIAIHLAAEIQPKGIFLLSPPAGNINALLRFQFFDWPIQLLLNQVDTDRNQSLTETEFASKQSTNLPVLGLPWTAVDANQDHALDLISEIIPTYEAGFKQVMALAETPAYHNWYYSLLQLEDTAQVLKRFNGNVWMYHSSSDSQLSWMDSVALSQSVQHLKQQRIYSGVGHCFSPFEGSIQEVKTSGPFESKLLDDLLTDLQSAL